MGRELMFIGLAFLLCGLFARAGSRIGLPTIPLFVAAGILVGPNTPGVVLFEHPEDLELLAAFGLIFLLFYLGVEFSFEQLTSGGSRLLAAAGIYLALNIGVGLLMGLAIGWGMREALVIAGVTGISSSAIVTKSLVELHRMNNPESGLIMGIIVIEDLFLALYLAALAPVLGNADSFGEGALLFLRAAVFLTVLAVIARYGVGLVEKVISADNDELLVLLFVGFALLVAGAAYQLGISDAIGAFMAGLVLAGTAAASRIEKLVRPLRDAFGALFFFAFGLSINPNQISTVAVPALVAIVITLLLAMVASIVAARLNGLDRQATANMAALLAARGEFALILVTLAVGAGLDDRLSPFVAVYVLVLALASPILAARSDLLVRFVPARLVPDSVGAVEP